MTEQQAPTLREALASQLQHAYFYSHGLSAAREGWLAAADVAIAHFELAKNIDTASPSPASLHERMKTALIELFHAEWSPGGHRYVEAQTAALRLGEELATPQPSPTGPTQVEPGSAERYAEQERKARSVPPTGPREGEPPECDYEACKRAHACKFYPCRAPDTASPSPASLQEAAISPSGIKTPPDEQIVAAWNAWPKTAITSRRSAIEFVRAVLSQRSADSPLASPVEAQELEDDPEAEAAFHMGYGGEAQETATPSLPLQEPVAWVTPMAYGSQVTFYKPSKPSDWDDSDRGDEWYCRPLYAAPSLPAVLTDARLWSFLRSVMSHAASIEAEHMGHGYEVRSAHLDAAASDYVDKLRALATSATPVLP